MIELGVEGAEKQDNLNEITSNLDNNEFIQKSDFTHTFNINDGSENNPNSLANIPQNDIE